MMGQGSRVRSSFNLDLKHIYSAVLSRMFKGRGSTFDERIVFSGCKMIECKNPNEIHLFKPLFLRSVLVTPGFLLLPLQLIQTHSIHSSADHPPTEV